MSSPFASRIRNMHVLGGLKLFGQAQIDHVDGLRVLFSAHQEVVRFDVAMNVALLVQLLNAVQLGERERALELARPEQMAGTRTVRTLANS